MDRTFVHRHCFTNRQGLQNIRSDISSSSLLLTHAVSMHISPTTLSEYLETGKSNILLHIISPCHDLLLTDISREISRPKQNTEPKISKTTMMASDAVFSSRTMVTESWAGPYEKVSSQIRDRLAFIRYRLLPSNNDHDGPKGGSTTKLYIATFLLWGLKEFEMEARKIPLGLWGTAEMRRTGRRQKRKVWMCAKLYATA